MSDRCIVEVAYGDSAGVLGQHTWSAAIPTSDPAIMVAISVLGPLASVPWLQRISNEVTSSKKLNPFVFFLLLADQTHVGGEMDRVKCTVYNSMAQISCRSQWGYEFYLVSRQSLPVGVWIASLSDMVAGVTNNARKPWERRLLGVDKIWWKTYLRRSTLR